MMNEIPALYNIAKQITLEHGMPWHDPRNGKRYDPPQQTAAQEIIVEIKAIVSVLDQHIEKLTEARNNILALDGTGKAERGGRRVLSAAARRRIGAAQRARWAEWKRKKH